jgi:hypothetical protein
MAPTYQNIDNEIPNKTETKITKLNSIIWNHISHCQIQLKGRA